MDKAIPLARQTIVNLVKSGSQIPKWILTEFKGGRQGVKVDLVTEDPEQLKRAVQSLKLGGLGSSRGPYYEEKALEGERCHPKQMRGGSF